MKLKFLLGYWLLFLAFIPLPGRAQTAPEITMMTWGGAFLDAFKLAATEFEKKTGTHVQFVTQVGAYDGYAKVQAQKNSPQIDVWATIESTAQAAADSGLVIPLDSHAIANLRTLPAEYLSPTAVSVWISPRGIFYRRDLVPFEIHAWSDLWDKRLQDKVGVSINLDNGSFLVMAALISGGSEKAIDAGFTKLSALKPNIAAVYHTDVEGLRLLQTGEVSVVGWGGLSNVYKLLGENSNYRFVVPSGPQFFPSARLALIKGRSPGKQAAAAQFVNFLLSPEIQTKMTAVTGTIPVNPAAVRPAALKSLIPAKLSPYQIDWTVVNRDYQGWLTKWNAVVQ